MQDGFSASVKWTFDFLLYNVVTTHLSEKKDGFRLVSVSCLNLFMYSLSMSVFISKYLINLVNSAHVAPT